MKIKIKSGARACTQASPDFCDWPTGVMLTNDGKSALGSGGAVPVGSGTSVRGHGSKEQETADVAVKI